MRDLKMKVAAVAAALAVACGSMMAQSVPVLGADGKPAAFDTASIRKNESTTARCGPEQLAATPSGFHLTNCPLIAAVGTAFAPVTGEPLGFLLGDRIVNVPDWVRSERYDIDARISDADAEAWKDPVRQKLMLRAMLQKLLEERCKLTVHREMKEKPSYAILVGKNGVKLPVSANSDLDALRESHPNTRTVPGGGGIFGQKDGIDIEFYGAPMGTLSLWLSDFAKQPVVDKTGLTGRYDITIPRVQSLQAGAGEGDSLPTIFTVMEGFGLKLEKQKDQVEMLVVDHVERPSEN